MIVSGCLLVGACPAGTMEHPERIFHHELSVPTQKARPSAKAGLFLCYLRPNQPRVRERIMKLSKVYSATCHHRYSSERYACMASTDFLKSGFVAEMSAHSSLGAFRQASSTALVNGRSWVPPATRRFNAVGFCMS